MRKKELENQYGVKPYTPKPTYQSQYGQQAADLANQYAGRQFQFDINKDQLWRQLTQQYQRGGQLAMQNTVGQVTAQTGGYGNSYAQTAGQQTYQQYMNGLYDMLPQVQNLARQNYDAETDRILQMYNMTQANEDREYGRYQDQLNQYYQDQNREDQLAQQEWQNNWQQYTYNQNREDQQAAQDRQDQQNAQQRIETMIEWYVSHGQTPPDDLLAQSQYDQRYWQAIAANYDATHQGGSPQNRYGNGKSDIETAAMYMLENGGGPQNSIQFLMANGYTLEQAQRVIRGG